MPALPLLLPLPVVTKKARLRRFGSAFMLSKVGRYRFPVCESTNEFNASPVGDPIIPHFSPTTDGFRLGSMSGSDFCSWIRSSSSNIQNSTIRHLTWWMSNKGPLHHQFIILTVEHCHQGSLSQNPNLYDLRIERIGKGAGFRGLAEHKVTIAPAESFDHLLSDNTLMFGLYDAPSSNTESRPTPPDEVPFPHSCAAFRDALDDKWRGPTARLWEFSRYLETVVRLFPKYSLATTNCYYFSRSLTHIIGLRHYSFSTLVSSDPETLVVRNTKHDPSGIGILFGFLDKEGRKNAVLLQAKLIFAVSHSIFVAAMCGVAYGVTVIARRGAPTIASCYKFWEFW